MADWFRSWHGAARDAKLTLAARKAGVPRAVAVAVWWDLLDIASQAEDRGDVSGANPEIIAIAQEADVSQVEAVLSAFHDCGMVRNGRIAAWSKRQPKREDDNSSERVRSHRERQRAAAAPGNADETQRNATKRDETHGNARAEQSRTEQSRTEQKAEPRVQAREAEPGKPDVHAVGRKCLEICGWTNDPGKNYAPVHQWLADGADPERHIYPTIRAILTAGKTPNSLAYFTQAITEARTKPTAPPPADPRYAPIVTDYDREMAQWRSRLMVFRDRGSWMASMWGPKPGEPGCKVPKAIIAEHEAAMVAA